SLGEQIDQRINRLSLRTAISQGKITGRSDLSDREIDKLESELRVRTNLYNVYDIAREQLRAPELIRRALDYVPQTIGEVEKQLTNLLDQRSLPTYKLGPKGKIAEQQVGKFSLPITTGSVEQGIPALQALSNYFGYLFSSGYFGTPEKKSI